MNDNNAEARAGLLSIVIPVYNAEDCLEETVHAILGMMYSQMEVILVNDGSTDETVQIMKKLQKTDSRVKLFHQENQGIAAARNTGLMHANGEYVCFCDQDDMVTEDGYATVIRKMQQFDACMGMCSTGQVADGQKLPLEKLTDGEYDGEAVQEHLLIPLLFRGYAYPFVRQEQYLYGTVWKCVFRRDFLLKNSIQFRRFVHYEDDWLFVTQALAIATRVVTCAMTGYYWVIHNQSESHRPAYIPDMEERFRRLDEWVSSYINKEMFSKLQYLCGDDGWNLLEEYHKVALADHYLELLRNAANAQREDRKACRKQMKQYLQETDYRQVMQMKCRCRKSAYRRRVIFTSLQYFGINVTYIVSGCYNRLEKLLSKVRFIVMLERKNKMK